MLFMMQCNSHGRCIMKDIIYLQYPHQLAIFRTCQFPHLDRGVTTASILVNIYHCTKCGKIPTSGVELKPSTSTSTNPSGSSPPWVLRTHCQHMADYTRLMMESGMDLTMGEDRAAPLITEIYSPMPTSQYTLTSQSILNFLFSQSCALFPFSFRPYRRFNWPTTSTGL